MAIDADLERRMRELLDKQDIREVMMRYARGLDRLDGDLLAVHRTSDARSGQVVVARIDNEVTVKRLKRKGNAIELLPENDALSPIVVDPAVNDFAIEGLAVGVIRSSGIH